jgi:peptidoglycan/xylan/chitin deacetylase (PgdA/CDA1 family)
VRPAFILLVSIFAAGCAGGTNTPIATSPVNLPSTTKGAVSVNFDDGYESGYNLGLPIVEAAGFKTTQFIITKRLDTPGYLTTGQVFAMQNSGHEIAAHTRTHPHLSTLTEAQQQDEILGSLSDLETLGLRPVSFAYPYGDYNDATLSIVGSASFLDARDTKRGFNGSSSNRLLLKSYVLGPDGDDSLNTITQAIDDAQANDTWLILVFHRVDETGQPTSVTHELVQGIIDHLVEKSARVVTMQQGLSIYGLK